MKFPQACHRLVLLCFPLLLTTAFAEAPAGSTNYLNGDDVLRVVMTNAFDADKPFSGVAQVHLGDASAPIDFEMGVAAQNGDIRFYLDKTKVKGDPIFVEAAKMYQREGLAHVATLYKKGDAARYTIFPDRRIYKHTDEPFSLLPPVPMPEPVSFQTGEAGTETVAGHICHKVQVRLVMKSSSSVVGTIWRAPDLNDGPLKAILDISGNVQITVQNVRTNALDPKLFQIPAGFREFTGSYVAPQLQFVTPTAPAKK